MLGLFLKFIIVVIINIIILFVGDMSPSDFRLNFFTFNVYFPSLFTVIMIEM